MVEVSQINKDTFMAAIEERSRRDNLRMLVVEDQKFSRLLLKNFLGQNYKVEEAATGEAALAEYVKNAPDMVFLDIELPGVRGHKVCSLINKLDPDAYVIMVSANYYKEEVEKSKQAGAKGFIAKPFTKDKIYECVNQYIQAKH